jgi:pectate lyase
MWLSPSSSTYTAAAGDAAYPVTVAAIKADGTADTFSAVSSNPAVATVSVNRAVAAITPVAPGTANIVFTADSDPKLTRTIVATVTPLPQLSLSPSSLTYTADAGSAPYNVTVTATKGDGTADTFTVKSSNAAVASASANGNVVTITPLSAGTANIVFTSGSSSKVTATIVATITVPTLTLSPANLTYSVVAGSAPFTIAVTAAKGDGSSDTFSVTSSNSDVAAVSASGSVVTITPGTALGTATVTFTSGSNSTVTKTIAVTTTSSAPSPKLTLSPSDLTYTVPAGSSPISVTVTAIKNDGVTADTFTATSDNAAVASVSTAGNAVTINPLTQGSANITITTTDGGLTATIAVTVTAYQGSITLSPSARTYVAEAGSKPYTVNVTALKADGVTPDTFTVTSSDPTVVTASATGNTVTITPVGAGTANVVFTADSNHNVTATIAATISLSGCDGTEWFCDDFQEETVTGSTVSSLTNWDLSPAATGNYGSFTVAADPNVTGNNVLSYAANNVNGSVVGLIPDSVWGPAMGSHTGDYYVEARINVSKASKNKQVYLISRYQLDASNNAEFYNGGLNFNGRTELGYKSSDVNTLKSSKGSTAPTVSTWYTVRFEMIGTTGTLYLNGVPQASYTYPAANVLAGGKVGLYSDNDSFLIDDIKIGAIQLELSATSYTAAAGSGPYAVTVTAVKPDGVTPDTYTVISSDPTIATAAIDDSDNTKVNITPVAMGTATITFTSNSNPKVTRSMVVTVTAPVVQTNASISVAETSYTAMAGSPAHSVAVTAVQADGTTPDTFTVTSNTNPSVATATVGTNSVTITPLATGNTTITLTLASDPTKTATIAVTVTPDQTALTLSPSTTTYLTTVGGAPINVTVAATKSDGTADTYTVSSDDTAGAIATATEVGSSLTITPIGIGTATFTITSGSGLTATIAVTVAADASALTLTPPVTSYTSNVGGAPHIVIVSAVKPDGTTPDTFTVSADDNGTVATTAVTDDQFTITPVAAGTSNITITSGSGKKAEITLTVSSGVSHCDGTEWFCDDFQNETVGNTTVTNWDLNTTPGGTFTVVQDADNPANTALQYSYGLQTAGAVIGLIKDSVWNTNVLPHLNATSDYYVEAHIKPQEAKSNKALCMVSHYTSASNFYCGGVNYSGPRLELELEQNGTLTTKYAQGTSPNASLPAAGTQGAGAGKEGTWITVRFVVANGVGSMYLNGVQDTKIGNKTLATLSPAGGKVGLFTNYDNFLIDDIRVGDPNSKPPQPAQLTLKSALGTPVTAYTAEVGDTATPVTVTALKGDGTADAYYVASSNPAVVTAAVDPTDSTGATVDFTPVGPGTANIVFFSASDPNVSVTVPATIGPQFVQPTTVYNLSPGQLSPAPGATNAYVDDQLVLTFDSAPALNGTGSVRIFKSDDDSLVDVIPLTGATDLIGLNYSSNVRAVNTTPIWISGNSVVIAPHQSKLSYGTSYYVAISDGSITGTLSGQNFTGIGKAGGWMFTTKSTPASGLTTLAVNGTGSSADFRTVQGALNYAMQNASTYTPTTPLTINVASGTYQELLFLRNVNDVTINGAGQSNTIIQYENYDSMNTGSGGSSSATAPTLTGGRSVFLVEGSDMLTLTDLTLKNTHVRKSGLNNQAETIYFNSDQGRLIAKSAEFDSEQDTLLLKGFNWFYNTLVTGNVDYIWGYSHAALFENSEIRTVGDSSASSPSGGYIVQARVPSLSDKGFVFLNDQLTYANGPSPANTPVANGTNATASTYLARSGGASGAYDNVVYMDCKMDTHIAPLGWAAPNINSNPNPTPATATATSGWREFGSLQMDGTTPLDISQRSPYSYQMTPSDLTTYGFDTRANIFSAYPGGWNPQP